jgi:protocatechuate 3,4-dioxygenase beta subunit
MYFPNDPLIPFDPIYDSVPEESRGRLISAFDMDATVPSWALAYRFDIVLRGKNQTPLDHH